MTKSAKKYYLKTFGCQSNMADSDRIRWIAESSGYQATLKENAADLIIYNTCSVRQSAEDRIFGRNKILKRLKENNPRLKTVLTGCMMHYGASHLKKRLPNIDIFLPITDLARLPAKIGAKTKIRPEEYLSIPPKHEFPFRAWVPISYGCNNFCTFCIVPFARGREYSRPKNEIIKEVEEAIKNGHKEIWLLGQNVNSYGIVEKTAWEGKTRKNALPEIQKGRVAFAKLIREINAIPGKFWIRFTSAHPKDFSNDLISAMAECEKFPKYINLPVQSGDNEVLKRMNRNYTREDFIKLVQKIRTAISSIAISTDTIVGFPGETKKEFMNTASLYKKIKFNMAFIAEYSTRSGTAASLAFADTVPHAEKERRREYLNEILKKSAMELSQPILHQTIELLVDEYKNGRFFGKSPQNKNVEIKGINSNRKIKIGDFVKIEITDVSPWKWEGRLI